ncbi:hypothetical protein NTGM5_70107 [Candidatus Nitrotoga sp. M5]|nr:hypothetical protein NTGM5_70107 [Candidatus Nitrotoga sp. M5]
MVIITAEGVIITFPIQAVMLKTLEAGWNEKMITPLKVKILKF